MDDSDALRVVATWRMHSEPKETWRYLWQKAGRRPGRVWVSYCEIGALQGVSERSGRRRIDTLAEHGLIRIVERLPGRVHVDVCEPREVCRDRTAEPERPLLEAIDSESLEESQACVPIPADAASSRAPGGATSMAPGGAADVSQQPPADVAQHPPRTPRDPSESTDLYQPSPLDPLEPLVLKHQGLPSRSAGSGSADVAQQPPKSLGRAADMSQQPPPALDRELAALLELERQARHRVGARHADHEQPVGSRAEVYQALLARVCALPGSVELAAARERIVERIRRRVADPKLRDKPMLRFAAAIVDGLIPERELDSLLACLDTARRDHTLAGEPWQYFVGTARKIFLRHGHAELWPTVQLEARR